jgi:hypothetical protein
MNSRPQAVTDLMARNLKSTIEELTDRYNKTGSTLTYRQIAAVRSELAELSR